MTTNTLTKKDRKAIYARDGYRCALCDSTKYIQIHHYLTRGAGGTNHPHNLITLCADCHAAAHGMILRDWPDTTKETIEQAIVEYLSDLYAEQGEVWNPYRNPSPNGAHNGPRRASFPHMWKLRWREKEREQAAPSDPGGLPGVVPPTNSGARPLGSGWSSSPGGSLRHARPRPLRGSGRGSLSPARRPPRHHFKT